MSDFKTVKNITTNLNEIVNTGHFPKSQYFSHSGIATFTLNTSSISAHFKALLKINTFFFSQLFWSFHDSCRTPKPSGEHEWTRKPCVKTKFFTSVQQRRSLIITYQTCVAPLLCLQPLLCDMPWFWTSKSKIPSTLRVPWSNQNRVSKDTMENLQELTTHKKDVYFIV